MNQHTALILDFDLNKLILTIYLQLHHKAHHKWLWQKYPIPTVPSLPAYYITFP